MAQVSLQKCADSPEPLLLAYTKYGYIAFVCVDTLCPGQQFFSHIVTISCLSC